MSEETMGIGCWVLATPDGESFIGLQLEVRRIDHCPPGYKFPPSPVMLFASREVAQAAASFFNLPPFCATPRRLATAELYNRFIADAWRDGARSVMVVQALNSDPRQMTADFYSVLQHKRGTGKSCALRWLLKGKQHCEWN